jgi:hypothetical protein
MKREFGDDKEWMQQLLTIDGTSTAQEWMFGCD